MRGVVKFYLHDYDGALIDLDKAHQMDPTSSSILRYGNVYKLFQLLVEKMQLCLSLVTALRATYCNEGLLLSGKEYYLQLHS